MRLRQDIPVKFRWNLKAIFKNNQEIAACEQEIKSAIRTMTSYKGKVAKQPFQAVKQHFALSRLVEQFYTYAKMQLDQDGSKPAYLSLMARADSLMVQAQTSMSFLAPELLSLPDEALAALKDDPKTPEYSVYFHRLMRRKPHVLSESEEGLLSQFGEVFSASSRAFNLLNNVDLPLPEISIGKEEKIKLTHAQYGILIRSADPAVRKAAFEGMMGAYGAFSSTISTLLISSIKNDVAQAKARKFKSAREASLFPNEIPEAVYDNLLKEAEKALPVLERYLALRKKALGLDELHLYDLYCPIAKDYELQLPFPKALQLVKDGLKPLGDEYQTLLNKASEERWMDVYESKGKRSGAYSWGTYDSHPYVLLNHTDDINGTMTLAHELGHSMHSYHSRKTQPYEKSGYSLFAAEVASTLNEMLLTRYLLASNQTREAQLFFLTSLAEDFRTTFFRQTMFADFEFQSHQMEEKGEVLTEKGLSDLYLSLNQKYYGKQCVIDPLIRHEWLRIPHFYRAYYVYQYATGFSAAVFLSDRILKVGQPAISDYFRFLKAGGSLTPIASLQLAGADMSKPKVIRSAMKVFEDTVSKLESLIG